MHSGKRVPPTPCPIIWRHDMGPRPIVYCFVAATYGTGHVWGKVGRVRLELAPLAIARGFTVIGPDPEDLIALAK